MGFSIGGLLGGIGELVSSVFGGSSGGKIISGGLQIASRALTPPGSPPGRATTPPPLPPPGSTQVSPVNVGANTARAFSPAAFRSGSNRFGGSFQTAALSGGRGAILGTGIGLAAEGVLGMFGGRGNGVSEILKEARENINGPVTKNKIIDAAKFCGIETAASTFGLNTEQVCLVIVHGRSRRRRGISAADIRRTRRVIRFNKKLTKDLKVR